MFIPVAFLHPASVSCCTLGSVAMLKLFGETEVLWQKGSAELTYIVLVMLHAFLKSESIENYSFVSRYESSGVYVSFFEWQYLELLLHVVLMFFFK